MTNAKAVAEVPYFVRRKIDLNNPSSTYLSKPALIFTTNTLRLLLTTVEVTYLGNDAQTSKTIKVVHRASVPTTIDPSPGQYDWDYDVASYTGTAVDIILNESDFEKVYLNSGDSVIIYLDSTYDAEANISITFRQV